MFRLFKEHKLKSELVQFEREEAERRLKPIRQSDENLSVIEAKPPSPAEKVNKTSAEYSCIFYGE